MGKKSKFVEVLNMNCPKCGKEMKQGFLQTGNLIAFNKTRHKLSLNSKDVDDVMIAQKAFTSSDFNGWICKECGLVTFDYTNVITHW